MRGDKVKLLLTHFRQRYLDGEVPLDFAYAVPASSKAAPKQRRKVVSRLSQVCDKTLIASKQLHYAITKEQGGSEVDSNDVDGNDEHTPVRNSRSGVFSLPLGRTQSQHRSILTPEASNGQVFASSNSFHYNRCAHSRLRSDTTALMDDQSPSSSVSDHVVEREQDAFTSSSHSDSNMAVPWERRLPENVVVEGENGIQASQEILRPNFVKVQLTIYNCVDDTAEDTDDRLCSDLDSDSLFEGRARFINRRPAAWYCKEPEDRWLYMIDASPLHNLTDIVSKWRKLRVRRPTIASSSSYVLIICSVRRAGISRPWRGHSNLAIMAFKRAFLTCGSSHTFWLLSIVFVDRQLSVFKPGQKAVERHGMCATVHVRSRFGCTGNVLGSPYQHSLSRACWGRHPSTNSKIHQRFSLDAVNSGNFRQRSDSTVRAMAPSLAQPVSSYPAMADR